MISRHIHIQGQVQGVGFRPFVFQRAKKYQLSGWVNNTNDGVHIECHGSEFQVQTFIDDLSQFPPPLARITDLNWYNIPNQALADFRILESSSESASTVPLTPDASVCPDCLSEMADPENRRHDYPFITCTHCGPRYSITRQVPFDRNQTSMDSFSMCPDCLSEYQNPLDRRHHSQTNSCATCGITQRLFNNDVSPITSDDLEIKKHIVQAWKSGKIIAIKGIGGFLLTCDANHPKAIQSLRSRKNRGDKPFAVMFSDLESLESVLEVKEQERKQLGYPESSIVLLDPKPNVSSVLAVNQLSPGLDRVGAMVAYTPLFVQLLQAFGGPVVATSGNISKAPIVYRNVEALSHLTSVADLILTNDRSIQVPQDDSVVLFTPNHHQKIILRRARGLAPNVIDIPSVPKTNRSVLCTGSQLKSSFAIQHHNQVYLSQYIGNLDHFDTQTTYRSTMNYWFDMLDFQADEILHDSHPTYFTNDFSNYLSKTLAARKRPVQHHLAHFCAILGEHNLLFESEPVLGVIWDGTGFGSDNQIWGGEFFKYEDQGFERCDHFSYFDWILGDKMAREPRLPLLSICHGIPGVQSLLQEKFTKTEWSIYTKKLSGGSQTKTSSMGRIFDALSSLLGLHDLQGFEGEAAMKVEQLARQYFDQNGWEMSSSYFLLSASEQISTHQIFEGIIEDLLLGKKPAFIAAKFHYSLIVLIRQVARRHGIRKLAFSGGVFQNAVLADLIHIHLSGDFTLFFHEQLAPNDENIAFGQLIWYHIQEQNQSIQKLNQQDHVFSNPR